MKHSKTRLYKYLLLIWKWNRYWSWSNGLMDNAELFCTKPITVISVITWINTCPDDYINMSADNMEDCDFQHGNSFFMHFQLYMRRDDLLLCFVLQSAFVVAVQNHKFASLQKDNKPFNRCLLFERPQLIMELYPIQFNPTGRATSPPSTKNQKTISYLMSFILSQQRLCLFAFHDIPWWAVFFQPKSQIWPNFR